METIKYNILKELIKHFEYNYPYKYTTESFYYHCKEDVRDLKDEILENIITLQNENKISYLERVRLKLDKLLSNTNEINIERWLKHYKVNMEEIFTFEANKELANILKSNSPTFDETNANGFNPNTIHIQNDFYNYYYKTTLLDLLDFIQQQKNIFSPKNDNNINESDNSNKSNKKSNSLVEISYDAFNKLLSHFELDYPQGISVEKFNYYCKNYYIAFEDEVLHNITVIEEAKIKYYLNHLRIKLAKRIEGIEITTKEYIKENIKEFNVEFDNIFYTSLSGGNDDLHSILYSPKPFIEHLSDKYDEAKIEFIQDIFFSYFIYSTVIKAIDFIGTQLSLYFPDLKINDAQISNQYKIKTTLSVAELGYLFKLLEKQNIISIDKGKREAFYRLIANVFESSQKEEFKNTTFKNKFTAKEPEKTTTENIKKHLMQMLQIINKDQS